METWAEFYVRVGSQFARAATDHAGKCIVVAGHGGTVGASFVALGELPIRRGAGITRVTENTSTRDSAIKP